MKLYHFTTPGKPNYRSSCADWSRAFTDSTPIRATMDWQTMGRPVVWLTTQESNRATKADVDHLKSLHPRAQRSR